MRNPEPWRRLTLPALLGALLLPVAAQAAPAHHVEATVRLPGLLLEPPDPAVIAPIAVATAAMARPVLDAPLPPPPSPVPPPPALPASFAPFAAAQPGRTRTVVLTLHQLGTTGPIELRGTSPLGGVRFGIRSDEVVTGATLALSGAISPAMMPAFSNDTVTLNGQYVGTVLLDPRQPQFTNLTFPVDPVLFTDSNRLEFHFTGRTSATCNDALSGLLWSVVSDASTLTLTLERLPPQRDLARLPRPFFDPNDSAAAVLPVILPAARSNDSLVAAAIAASWFGLKAGDRGARFPVQSQAPSEGNAILVVTGLDRPAGITLPTMSGPTLAVIPNPNDPAGSLLLVGGRSGTEAVTAATALALGSHLLAGGVATAAMPDAPYRRPYDAPAWLPTDRPVKLAELVDAATLEGTGYAPGPMRVPFRAAPGLTTWHGRAVPLEVGVRAPPGPIVDLQISRLDIGLNGQFLASLPLAAADQGTAPTVSRLEVPVSRILGQNELEFSFDTRPMQRGECSAVPDDLREAIDPDSTIDLSGATPAATLPDLAAFTGTGFPFTRLADLADTAAVLPAAPSPGELGAFLDLMGRFGALTGYPVTRLAVVRPDAVASVSERNLLLMGTLTDLGPAADLLRRSPYRLDRDRLHVSLSQPRAGVVTALASAGAESAAIVGAASPFGGGRSLVALLGGSPEALAALVAALHEQEPAITGDLALLNGGRITAYRVGQTYGSRLPVWFYPAGVGAAVLVGCLVAAASYTAFRRRARV